MTSSRWATLTAVVLLAIAPAVGLAACGSSDSNGAGDDGGGGDDATTTDGAGGDATGRGDAVGDGGAGDGHKGDVVCPAPKCPPGALCGHYTDPCSGTTITCGTPCPKGQSCVGTGNGSTSCQAPSCTGKCGVIGTDSCGVAIGCGGCPTGQNCVNNQCFPITVSDAGPTDGGPACGALTCTPNANTTLCGTIADSCGDTKQCPACPAGQECVGGVCGAPPPECAATDAGPHCGNVANACGSGSVVCPGCTGNSVCQAGTCVGCTPPSCGSMTCGTLNNGCGGPVSCGSCTGGGEKCYDGGCCMPLTCAQAAEAGAFQGCAQVDLGCGVHQSCSTCGSGEKCYDGGCCTPLTCAQAQDAGLVKNCGPVDLGCGVAQSCSTCGAGETCYDAGCCTPLTCAQAQDAGLVTGCGKVPLGCGVAQSCSPCPAGQTCEGNVCINCQPKTCADFGNTGCGHSDGCTSTPLDCCAAGTTCSGTICCPPGQVNAGGSPPICCPPGEINAGGICCPKGEVNYQQTCCQPKCDTSLPPGPQNSCGLTIYCNGTQ